MVVETGNKDDQRNPIREPRYGFHIFRHAAASLFIQHLKWSPKRLQTVMGHSSVRMTFDQLNRVNLSTERRARFGTTN